jgi:hypothetical protein
MCQANLDSSDVTIDIKRSIDDAIDKLDEIGII